MPFTLVAWYQALTGAQTLVAIDAVSDPHLRAVGKDVWVPAALPMMGGCHVLGVVLTAVRVESPTLRVLTPIDIIPFDIATEPESPPKAFLQFHSPVTVGGTEALNIKVTTTGDSAPVGLAWLCDGPLTPVTGEIFTVKCTSATTLTAYKWTNGALTFAQSLPSGRYQVVGMRAKSATLIAARLVLSGYAWRPGCIGCDAYNDEERVEFRHGRTGAWGEFDHDVPPTVDFLSADADTSEEVWLDLIKIA